MLNVLDGIKIKLMERCQFRVDATNIADPLIFIRKGQ